MKKIAVLSVFFLVCSMAAMAQDFPKAEVFGGYSYAHLSEAGVGFNLNGGSGSVAFNPHKSFGIVADIGGYHTNKFGVGATIVTYLFGPKFAYRENDRVTPYFHALFGGAHASAGGFGITGTDNAFAMALGGGVDAKVNDNFAIRVAQVDYILTKFTDGVDDRQNSVRISTGIVFRFGK